MKNKVSFICIALIALFISSNAKAQSFDQGKVVISAGYGFPSFSKSLFKAYESNIGYTIKGLGPLHFRGEYGVSERIGLVLSVNYNAFEVGWTDNITGPSYSYNINYSSLSVLGRVNYHFAHGDKLDSYVGAGLGYRTANWEFTSTDAAYDFSFKNTIPLGFEATVGLRYYFIPNLGVYTELGMAKSAVQAGLVAKF